MSHGLAPDVRDALGAVGRVAAALVSADSLDDVAVQAISEMRDALDLEAAGLYLAHPGAEHVLEQFVHWEADDSGLRMRERIPFDNESWRLTVQTGRPLVLRERADWLMEHPFDPPVTSWLVLPLGSGANMAGVAIAAAREHFGLTATAAAVVTLIGDLLSAGIHTARLRQELQRTAIERERMRLAAEVHDGLAQDLALAMRELTLLDAAEPSSAAAQASRARLREAVASAHSIVRGRLKELSGPSPIGGLQPAVKEMCDRFAHRGMPVSVAFDGRLPEPDPLRATVILRVLGEALTNIEKHAEPERVDVGLSVSDRELVLTVDDDGRGFDLGTVAGPGEGHLGLRLMHERARAAGGALAVSPRTPNGTRVLLSLPYDEAVAT